MIDLITQPRHNLLRIDACDKPAAEIFRCMFQIRITQLRNYKVFGCGGGIEPHVRHLSVHADTLFLFLRARIRQIRNAYQSASTSELNFLFLIPITPPLLRFRPRTVLLFYRLITPHFFQITNEKCKSNISLKVCSSHAIHPTPPFPPFPVR